MEIGYDAFQLLDLSMEKMSVVRVVTLLDYTKQIPINNSHVRHGR